MRHTRSERSPDQQAWSGSAQRYRERSLATIPASRCARTGSSLLLMQARENARGLVLAERHAMALAREDAAAIERVGCRQPTGPDTSSKLREAVILPVICPTCQMHFRKWRIDRPATLHGVVFDIFLAGGRLAEARPDCPGPRSSRRPRLSGVPRPVQRMSHGCDMLATPAIPWCERAPEQDTNPRSIETIHGICP